MENIRMGEEFVDTISRSLAVLDGPRRSPAEE